jgi:hypothetical protein
VTVTVTPGSAPPLSSEIVPAMLPFLVACAHAVVLTDSMHSRSPIDAHQCLFLVRTIPCLLARRVQRRIE